MLGGASVVREGGLTHHQRPVGAALGLGRGGRASVCVLEGGDLGIGLRLVVGGVVAEDGRSVEGRVILGEVQLR